MQSRYMGWVLTQAYSKGYGCWVSMVEIMERSSVCSENIILFFPRYVIFFVLNGRYCNFYDCYIDFRYDNTAVIKLLITY